MSASLSLQHELEQLYAEGIKGMEGCQVVDFRISVSPDEAAQVSGAEVEAAAARCVQMVRLDECGPPISSPEELAALFG